MQSIFLIIIFVISLHIQAASSGSTNDVATLPTADSAAYLTELKNIAKKIRMTKSEEEYHALTSELKRILEIADPLLKSDPIYQQIAYALFFNNPEDDLRDPVLTEIQNRTKPIMIHENLYCIALPSGKEIVVIEKVTTETIKKWTYYIHNTSFGSRFAYRRAEDIKDSKDYWRKNLLDKAGWNYFSDRIKSWHDDLPYEMWVACLINIPVEALVEDGQIYLNDLKMVTTIQMSDTLPVYSPMGITRTVEEAKKLFEDERRGIPRIKLNPSESIWLHALTGRIIKHINPLVTSFWTTPLDSMKHILSNTLYPDGRGPKDDGKIISYTITAYDERFRSCPWKYEPEFRAVENGHAIEVNLQSLWHTLFPIISL